MWMTGKTGIVKCVRVCAYASVNEEGKKGMNEMKCWEEFGHCLKKLGNVSIWGYMNSMVVSVEIGGVVDKWNVQGANENGHYILCGHLCRKGTVFGKHFLSVQDKACVIQATFPASFGILLPFDARNKHLLVGNGEVCMIILLPPVKIIFVFIMEQQQANKLTTHFSGIKKITNCGWS